MGNGNCPGRSLFHGRLLIISQKIRVVKILQHCHLIILLLVLSQQSKVPYVRVVLQQVESARSRSSTVQCIRTKATVATCSVLVATRVATVDQQLVSRILSRKVRPCKCNTYVRYSTVITRYRTRTQELNGAGREKNLIIFPVPYRTYCTSRGTKILTPRTAKSTVVSCIQSSRLLYKYANRSQLGL